MARDSSVVAAPRLGDTYAAIAGGGAAAGDCGVGVAQPGCGEHAEQRGPVFDQAQRDRPACAAMGEVAGAVDRIHHPAQRAGPRGAAFLALEAVFGERGEHRIR
jgi:hypothetical protein